MPSPSLVALGTAVNWAAEQGMTIRGLLSAEQLERLRRTLAGERAWSFDLYEPLRALMHALPRLQLPDLPVQVHLSDGLTGLNELLVRDAKQGSAEGALGAGLARYTWDVDHQISTEVFAALGYAQTSAGISAVRSRNHSGWRAHAERNKQLLLSGATAAGGGVAAVVGAGKVYDIPLRELAERFDRVLLIDVDAAAMQESVGRMLGSDELSTRVELVSSEVTGINRYFVNALDRIVRDSFSEEHAYQALLALLYSYRTAVAPSLTAPGRLGEAPLAACFSSMVLSQLAAAMTFQLERQFHKRFGASDRLRTHEFKVALGQFSHRVQHDHLRAVFATGRVFTITSDVAEQYTRLGPRVAGQAARQELASDPLPLIGAPHLEDLLPVGSTLLENAEWRWQRVAATPKKPQGRLLEVNGCVAAVNAA